MRTTLFLLSAALLLAAMLVLAKLFVQIYPSAYRWAIVGFVVLWLVVAVANTWIGVAKAGYSAAEELPVMLLVFGIPAVVAVFLKWKVF